MPVSTHHWKNLSIDFVIELPVSTNWKGETYDSILVIVDQFTNMVDYEPVKIIIDAPGLAEIIINVAVKHYDLPNSIVSDRGSVFIAKFWSLLCYFLGIKQSLSTPFHSQTDGQTEKQNSTIEIYLQTFVNYEQNDWARFLLIAEFAYNIAKNTRTGYTPFKLNCEFYPRVSYKEDINPRSRSKPQIN